MKLKFENNYTDQGYLMKYEKSKSNPYAKNHLLQFKIELQDIEPLIWRRILVPSDYNFWDLHVAIQDSMGWQDRHLHHFEIRGKGKQKEDHIGIPDFDGIVDLQEVFPGWEIPMFAYFNDLSVQAKYLYDYGDDWYHIVKLEGYIFREKGVKYPVCIGGERACPPEDCGGFSGYLHLIKTLADPGNPEHDAMKSWLGREWDPDKFNQNKIRFEDPYIRWKKAFLNK